MTNDNGQENVNFRSIRSKQVCAKKTVCEKKASLCACFAQYYAA